MVKKKVRMFDDKEVLSLIRRAKKGDEEAFGKLYRRYDDRVFKAARGVVEQPDLACDIAANTWLKVYLNLKRFNFESSFVTWAHRIAVNEGLQHLRKYRKRVFDISLDEQIPYEEGRESFTGGRIQLSVPDRQQESFPAREDIHRALLKLPPKYRTVVALSQIEGYTGKELAEMMGKSLTAVKSDIYRGVSQLKATFRTELTSPAELGIV
jgi:RNA polymerase sigma-70 factor (ECF subfamily)